MVRFSDSTLKTITQDLDKREDLIRQAVCDQLAQMPRPDLSEQIVATYFVCARTMKVEQTGREICYHMTSGIRHPPAGSLLEQCTGRVIDSAEFDPSGRVGLVRSAFPLKMLLHEDGSLYSTDILHIAAGAGVFALTEHADVKLVNLAMSDDVLRKFPGPAHGAEGVRRITNFDPEDIAFGTILKPCTGMTAEQEAEIIGTTAANPLFLFIKEDENFLPAAPFAPLEVRLKHAVEAVRRGAAQRGSKGVIFAPHISSPPHLLADNVKRAIDAGVNGIMFSEYYTGGAVRMVRELTRSLSTPPAIYGHNGGITTRTRHIYREVLDLLARLDGIDFRQTAPLASGLGLLRPFGREWRGCERVLSMPLAGHRAVMMARAGGLDQGNIIPNLIDVANGAGVTNYLFLAGSAINGIKNSRGRADPALGAEAMTQALQVYQQGVFAQATDDHVRALKQYADDHRLTALSTALSQRYGL